MTSISHTSTAIRDCDQFVLLGDSVAATESSLQHACHGSARDRNMERGLLASDFAESCLVVRSADYKVTFCAKQCSRQ